MASCALLVTGTNAANTGKGYLFGYWGNDKESTFNNSELINGQENRKDLVFVPLVKATSSVDPDAKEEYVDNAVVIENQALSANISPMKDPEEEGGVKMYEVQSGDTVSGIAAKFNITSNTILWANDVDNIDQIKPGDKLFILPVAGLTYTVAKDDTIDKLAEKYKAEKDKIIAFNDLPADGKLEEGQEIIIPDGEKSTPPSTSPTDQSGIARRQYANSTGGSPSVSGWRDLEGRPGAGHKFPYGYCTWYVAQKRFVPWGGNAGTWLYHAKVAGYKTGKTPRVGSIMVSSESWWGHVALVESVSGSSFTVSEMNYRGWAKKSTRTISTNNRVIKGFIY